MGRGLRHGPLGAGAIHLCVDMQRLFAPGGPWPTPWAARILPAVVALAAHAPARTVFSRFIPPLHPEALPGTWQAFYRKWRDLTRDSMDEALLDLVPELAQFVPPAAVVDKVCYSVFAAPGFAALRADTLVLSGAETDICVLATAFDAVDRGYRTVVAADAVCSSSDTGHDAVLAMLETRLSVQVEVATTQEILDAWRPRASEPGLRRGR